LRHGNQFNIPAVVGGIAIIVSFFLPWLDYPNNFGQLSGFKIVTNNLKLEIENIMGE